MTDSTHISTTASSGTAEPERLRDVALAMRHLVTSAEPAVVFSSLAKLCVPAFSDACTVEIVEDERAGYRISYPRDGPDELPHPPRRDATAAGVGAPEAVAGYTVSTEIEAIPAAGHLAYAGVVLHTWRERRPTPVEIAMARLLVDRAVDSIHHERLAGLLHGAEDRVANLRAALDSNRQIGVAIGILMNAHQITDRNAFDVLRTVSQNSNRKLRDLAADVVLTGALEPHPGDARTGP